MVTKHKIWFSSADFILAPLLIACAWGKLSWGWFWLVMLVEMLVASAFNEGEK